MLKLNVKKHTVELEVCSRRCFVLRYIGGKSHLLDCIEAVLNKCCKKVDTIMDLFAGTGVVSRKFKSCGYRVISNDFLYFSYVLQKCYIELNELPDFRKIGCNPVEVLNSIDVRYPFCSLDNCFIYKNYSPAGSGRMYFRPENALKIDLIRLKIEEWYRLEIIDDNGYFYLLASLLEAVPYVSNIVGVYASYLKFWDKRAYNSIVLKPPVIYGNSRDNEAVNSDYLKILQNYECDFLYADPPYNSREYLPNYHVLETIARYDYPEIYGVTGMRRYDDQRSDFCKKARVFSAFENLVRNCRSKYLLISYNNEGLLSTEALLSICERYAVPGTFTLYEYDYRRYKSKISNNAKGLKEQLYFLERI